MKTALWTVQAVWGIFFSITGVKPMLTPIAAIGLTLVMILAAVFHIVRGEYNFLLINVVLGGVAAFIAYGWLVVSPIAPASISTVRVLKGLAALGAVALVDFAPVCYKLTHLLNDGSISYTRHDCSAHPGRFGSTDLSAAWFSAIG